MTTTNWSSSSSSSSSWTLSHVLLTTTLWTSHLLYHPSQARTWIGNLQTMDHDVAGQVYALSDRVLEVENFVYDGEGPAAFWWASSTARPSNTNARVLSDGWPSNNCATSIQDTELPEAQSVTQRVEFPEGTSLADYLGGSLSVWCEQFNANFGHVVFPSSLEGLDLDPTVDLQCSTRTPTLADTPEGYNCEELNDDLQVRWQIENDNVKVELITSRSLQNNQYVAFGISGQPQTTSFMLGADVAIADWPDDATSPRIRDFYLDSRAQCSGTGAGVCPDPTQSGFSDDIVNRSGERDDGLTVVRYARPLMAGDTGWTASNFRPDQAISWQAGAETYIVWAVGPISASTGNPLIHTNWITRGGTPSLALELGRSVQDNCTPLLLAGQTVAPTMAPPPPFARPIVGDTETTISAHIGPSGGPRGYMAITGRPAWGIAWYLNGVLIPRLILRRDTEYTFRVNGGNDPSRDAAYHPFYLTDSPIGGYAQISPQERAKETIYAGTITIDESSPETGVTQFTANTEAPICRIVTTDASANAQLKSWQEYADTLDMSCADDAAIVDNAAVFKFTPDWTTPDRLYYHCVTHTDLGFEIYVLDEGETLAPTAAPTEPQPPPQDFKALSLTGQLEGSVVSFRINKADPGANGADTISVIVEVPSLGWVAWAASRDGFMIGSEAVIGLPDTGEVLKHSLAAQNRAGVQPLPDDQQTLIDASIVQGASSTTLRFTKILEEEGEIPIDADGENAFLTAFGSSNTLAFHQGRESYRFDFSSGTAENLQVRRQSLWQAHGWLASIAWGVLSPLAIGAAVCRKLLPGDGLWFQIHRGLNLLVVSFTVMAFAIAVAAINQETVDGADANHFRPDPNPHRTVGLVIFVFAFLQALGGIFRPHLPEAAPTTTEDPSAEDEEVPGATSSDSKKQNAPEEKSGARKGWEYGHRFLGISLLAMSLYQINAGINIYEDLFSPDINLSTIYWVVTVVLIAAVCAGGIVSRMSSSDGE